MGTIFKQILDSENIFKTKSNEITEKQEQILNIKKKIEEWKTQTETVHHNIVVLRAKIANQLADKEFILQKVEMIKKQLEEIKIKMNAVKLEHNTMLLRYQKSREDMTLTLSSHTDRIVVDNANLKQIEPSKYEAFHSNKLELEALEKDATELNVQLSNKNYQIDDLNSKVNSMRNKVSISRSFVVDLRTELEDLKMESNRVHHLNKMETSISNYEAEIASMISEITNKRQYINNFKNFTTSNHAAYMPRKSAHFDQDGPLKPYKSPYNVENSYHRYQLPLTKTASVNCVTASERIVVTGPPVPSSTPEEDDLFDDDVISEEVLRACDEAQMSSKGQKK